MWAVGPSLTPSRRAAVVLTAAAAGWGLVHLCSSGVRSWSRSKIPARPAGPLSARVVGQPDRPVIVLLHGIVGSGDYFGAHFDALGERSRLVVPDLLGFGGSFRHGSTYGLSAHLDALDAMAEALGIVGRFTVAGHSMGAVLALHWAARHADRVDAVLAVSPPLYDSRSEGLTRIRGMGRVESLLAVDTALARATCAAMCRFRRTAGWLVVGIKPALPVHVARSTVQHTWASFNGSMEGVVLTSPWREALGKLDERGVSVTLAAGARDPVQVPGRLVALVADHQRVRSVMHPTARHHVPLTDPGWCTELLGRIWSEPLNYSVPLS